MKTDAEYLEELTEITETISKSGWVRRIQKKHKDLYSWLIDKTDNYELVNFMESIYIVKTGILPGKCSQGNKLKFISYSLGYKRTCSHKCKCFKELSREITIENQKEYSDEKWKNINDRVTNTCLKKYKANRPTSTKSIIYNQVQQKSKNTCIEKYNHISYVGSERQKYNSLEKYGTESPSQSNIVKEKYKETCLNNFGVEYSALSPKIIAKRNQTNLEKWGTIFPTKNLEIKQRAYNAQVASGKYKDPSLKNDWEIYRSLSKFKGPLALLINSIEEQKLFDENGSFHSWKNKEGVTRDHMFSRRHGFDNKIFPEIIRHPANCKIISHKHNASKGYRSSISLADLFEKIKDYTNDYKEQLLVLNLIEKYIKGHRWYNLYNKKGIM